MLNVMPEWRTFEACRYDLSTCTSWNDRKYLGSGGGGGGKTGAIGLLRHLCGESVRMLLASRLSAQRCVLGVTGGNVCSVGGVVGTTSWILMNLLRVSILYPLE